MTDRAAGIDVSRWQPVVDWPRVKLAGTSFVLVKATQGTSGIDDKFASHWAGAKSVGLLRGAYHFYQPTVNPVEQAQKFFNKIASDPGELPPVFDIETTGGVGPAGLRDGAAQWLQEVERLLGRRPILYTRASYWNIYLRDLKSGQYPDWTANYPLWTAHYTTGPKPMLPKGWNAWTIWQYTESGALDGIRGKVDRNWYNGTAQELTDWVNAGGSQPLAPVPDEPVSFAAEEEVLPTTTNQDVINGFIAAFGNSFWEFLQRTDLESLSRDRESPYFGPAIDAMPNLTDEEKGQLRAALTIE